MREPDLHVSKPVKKATLLAAIESVVPAAAAAPSTAPEHDHEGLETDAALPTADRGLSPPALGGAFSKHDPCNRRRE
jgi:hypothetical protein